MISCSRALQESNKLTWISIEYDFTAHVLHKQDRQWLLCNDKAVLPIQSSEVDNKYSYVLFYELS